MKRFLALLFLLTLALPAHGVTRLYDRNTGDIVDADKDDAEWDNTNNAVNTHIADTSAHDATGGVVGVSKVQTLSNKTFSGNVPLHGGGTTSWYSDSGSTLKASLVGSSGAFTTVGDIKLESGSDFLTYSDAGTTLTGTLDSATGATVFGLKRAPIFINLNIVQATTTTTDDSVKIQCGNAACSSSNFGYAVLPAGATSGQMTIFKITADVTIKITGADYGQSINNGTAGDFTGGILRVGAANDNDSNIRWCVAFLGGRTTLLTTDTNATQSNVNTAEEVLCDTAVGSANNSFSELGWVRFNFDDTGGSAENLVTIQSGVGDINFGSADGIWRTWKTSPGGFSVDPGYSLTTWTQVGRTIYTKSIISSNGTSNSTSYNITMPAKAARSDIGMGVFNITNNGAAVTTPGTYSCNVGSRQVDLFRDTNNATWTAVNSKGASMDTAYEVGPVASFLN